MITAVLLLTFRELCVTPLPSPEGFVAAINAGGARWHRLDRTPAEISGIGNGWRSGRGGTGARLSISRRNPTPLGH